MLIFLKNIRKNKRKEKLEFLNDEIFTFPFTISIDINTNIMKKINNEVAYKCLLIKTK